MEAHAEISKMPAIATVVPTAVSTVVLPAGPAAIAEAAEALAAGQIVAFPTETVYGLGADATNDAAVARLYAAKERPSFNPLIAHVAGDLAGEGAGEAAAAALDAARRLAHFDADAVRLAQAFWPGPLTLVLPKLPGCPVGQLATAGLDTIAVRAPSHPVARAILAAFGKPVVAPSANRSGRVSPTSAQHVLGDLAGRIDLVIDGGAAPVGVESTVLACRSGGVALLRPGAIPRAAVEAFLGRAAAVAATAHDLRDQDLRDQELEAEAGGSGEPRLLAPGMLASHYAPRAMVRLNAVTVLPGEALLAFGPVLPPDAGRARMVLNLSGRGDLVEAAANLFSHLRRLDAAEVSAIAVMPVPDEGLGEAINDRLRHAAAPRPGHPQSVGKI
jgi:L-threonylcarbamoyladenylate synthase